MNEIFHADIVGQENSTRKVRGGELSRVVDKLVLELKKNYTDEGLNQLYNLLKQDLRAEIHKFCKRWGDLLERNSIKSDDLMSFARRLLVERWRTWDPEKHQTQGGSSANFRTYFVSVVLSRALYQEYAKSFLARKRRTDKVISLDDEDGETGIGSSRQSDSEVGESGLMLHVKTPEERLIDKQMAEQALEILLENRDPFLSLVVILHYGLGQSALNRWCSRYSESELLLKIRQGKIEGYRSFLQKAAADHAGGIDLDNGLSSPDIGQLTGLSGAAVRQKLDKAMAILQKEFIKNA